MFWRLYFRYRWAISYFFAFALTFLAIGWSLYTNSEVRIFRFLYPAGFFSVWFGGLGAGLFSVFLGTAAFLYLSFFDPTFGALSS